jgi:hypothetical protein
LRPTATRRTRAPSPSGPKNIADEQDELCHAHQPMLINPRSLAFGLLLAGCEPKQPSAPSPPEINPDIEQLEACARDLAAIETANPRERSSLIAAALSPSAGACLSIVVAGCEVEMVDSTSSFVIKEQMDAQRRLCVERACPDLDPRPALCDDPDASSARTPDEVVDVLTEFLAAKLANQLALARDDARVLAVGRAYAWLWSAPMMMSRIQVSPPRYADPVD